MDCDSSSSVLFLLFFPTVLGLRPKKGFLHRSTQMNSFQRTESFLGAEISFAYNQSEFFFRRLNTFVVDAFSLH